MTYSAPKGEGLLSGFDVIECQLFNLDINVLPVEKCNLYCKELLRVKSRGTGNLTIPTECTGASIKVNFLPSKSLPVFQQL